MDLVFGGRYRVQGEPMHGAMGAVYPAVDIKLGRKVALKTIRLEFVHSEDGRRFVEQFKRETRSLVSLGHPNIVVIYDADNHQGTPYLVMEWVDGGDLKRLNEKEGPLSLRHILSIIEALAAALDHAHSKNIIHRDVKPANVMLTADGVVKLTDFGVAKSFGGDSLLSSHSAGAFAGTPIYAPPEAFTGENPWSPLGDQYSLGVVTYELMLGRWPFYADNLMVLMQKIVTGTLPSRQVTPWFPPAAYATLARVLASRPENRYPSCMEFVLTLRGQLENALVDDEQLVSKWLQLRKGTIDEIEAFRLQVSGGRLSTVVQRQFDILLRKQQEEEEHWRIAKVGADTIGLQQFVDEYPSGRYARDARDLIVALRAERELWDEVQISDEPDVLDDFLRQFPKGAFAEPARRRLAHVRQVEEAWRSAVAAGTEQSLEGYLAGFPASRHAHEARCLIAKAQTDAVTWKLLCLGPPDRTRIEQFLEDRPIGRLAAEARRQLDLLAKEEREWARLDQGDPKALQTHIQNFPTGTFATFATLKIDRLQQEEGAFQRIDSYDIVGYQDFLRSHPGGVYESQARARLEALLEESNKWHQVEQNRTPEGVASFLAEFPQGAHAGLASSLSIEPEKLQQQEQDWDNLPRQPTRHDLERFLKQWPTGPHTDEARRQIAALDAEREAWILAENERSSAALRSFLAQHPDGMFSPAALALVKLLEEEERVWHHALNEGTIASLQQFREQYPTSQFADEAEQREASLAREELALRRALEENTASGYEELPGEFPDSSRQEGVAELTLDREIEGHASESSTPVAEGPATPPATNVAEGPAPAQDADRQAYEQSMADGSPGALQSYLKQFPAGAHCEDVRNHLEGLGDEAWRSTEQSHPAKLAQYLRRYPNGKHASQARARKRTLVIKSAAPYVGLAAGLTLVIFGVTIPGRLTLTPASKTAARYSPDALTTKSPASIPKPEGETLAERWQKLRPSVLIAELRQFARANPNTKEGKDAVERAAMLEREAKAWPSVEKATEASVVEAFLREFADGRFADAARKRRVEVSSETELRSTALASRNARTLRDYLERYRDNPNAGPVRDMLNVVVKQACDRVLQQESIEEIIATRSEFGCEANAGAIEERLRLLTMQKEWQRANRSDESAMLAFLKKYQGTASPLVDEAQKTLQRLQQSKQLPSAPDVVAPGGASAPQLALNPPLPAIAPAPKRDLPAEAHPIHGGLPLVDVPGNTAAWKNKTVTVPRFRIGQTEVSVGAYIGYAEKKGVPMPNPPAFNRGWRDKSQPMVNVSAKEASEFCRSTGGRLPTELEWEFAAAGGNTQNKPVIPPDAVYSGSGKSMQSVDAGSPNPIGLKNMFGNAQEYTESEGQYVLRGGSLANPWKELQAGGRRIAKPNDRENSNGFRCVY